LPPPDGDTPQRRPERVTDDDRRADLAFAILEASNSASLGHAVVDAGGVCQTTL
jgi:hypothetical protein